MIYYTGVGARKTPPYVLALMNRIAIKFAWLGYTLRSGGAIGADTAFELGAGTKKHIYYADYHSNPKIYYDPAIFKQAQDMAGSLHSHWHKCSPFVKKLHGRNAFQVLGTNLDNPAKFCVCWTPDGCITHATREYATGGTGTAISIAQLNGIPVINLAIPTEYEKWDQWANTRE